MNWELWEMEYWGPLSLLGDNHFEMLWMMDANEEAIRNNAARQSVTATKNIHPLGPVQTRRSNVEERKD